MQVQGMNTTRDERRRFPGVSSRPSSAAYVAFVHQPTKLTDHSSQLSVVLQF
nr:unnamed protein product [Digitaria exilis]